MGIKRYNNAFSYEINKLKADAALYDVKNNGKNGIAIYHQGMIVDNFEDPDKMVGDD